MQTVLLISLACACLLAPCYAKEKDCKKEASKEWEGLTCADLGKKVHSGNCLTVHEVGVACKCTCDAIKNGDTPTFGDKTTKAPKTTPPDETEPTEPTEPTEGTAAPTDAPAPDTSCFHGDTFIQTRAGPRTIKDLVGETGMDVMTLDTKTNLQAWSPIAMWIHAEPDRAATFVRVQLSNGHSLDASGEHLAYVVDCQSGEALDYKYTKQLVVGDCMKVAAGQAFQTVSVESAQERESVGIYNLVTKTGTLLANDIVMSCYSGISDHLTAHFYHQAMVFARSLLPQSIVEQVVSLVYSGDAMGLPAVTEGVQNVVRFMIGQK